MPSRRGPALARLYRLAVAIAVGALALLVQLRWSETPLLHRLELVTLDLRLRLRGPLAPGPDVVLVAIDDRTIERIGRWPLPREVLAETVDRLADAGAAVIVLDLLLIEPGPADGDARLAAAMQAAARVVLPYAFVLDDGGAPSRTMPPAVRASRYRVHTTAPGAAAAGPPQATGIVAPAEPMADAAASLGSATLLVDVDGALRFSLPVVAYAGELYPSLPVEAVRRLAGLAHEEMTVRLGRGVDIGAYAVPTDAAMRQHVSPYGPDGTIDRLALIDVLEGRGDAARLRGRIAVVGATALGVGDRFATPLAERLPGAEHLATAIDNILTGRSIRRDAGTGLLDLAAIVAMAGLGAGLAGRRSLPASLAVLALLLGGWWATGQAALATASLWLSALVPSLTGLAAVAIVEGTRIAAERRSRRRLERQRANLARYFAPGVVERLASADDPAELERTQDAAVMFIDIVGFTRIAEPMAPRAAMALLREFHTRVERAVFAHRGMVEKFAGDGALACFGVPEPDPAAAAHALRAAGALLADLALWAEERRARGEAVIRAGIGIHHGAVLMGDIGGRQQFQFTVIGDTVNVASRLEAMTRTEDTDLIVSDDALAAARAADADPALVDGLEPLGELALRGRTAPIRLWKLARPRQHGVADTSWRAARGASA